MTRQASTKPPPAPVRPRPPPPDPHPRPHRLAEGHGPGHARLPPDLPQAAEAERYRRSEPRRRRRRRAPRDEEGGPSPHGVLASSADRHPGHGRLRESRAERRLRRGLGRPAVGHSLQLGEPSRGGQPDRGGERLHRADPAARRGAQPVLTLKSAIQSSASGLASESRLAALSGAAPSRIFFTGTSSFLFESVRGTSGICTIRSGTCLGEQYSRTRRRISATTSSVSASRTTTNRIISSSTSTTRLSSTSSTPSTAL